MATLQFVHQPYFHHIWLNFYIHELSPTPIIEFDHIEFSPISTNVGDV